MNILKIYILIVAIAALFKMEHYYCKYCGTRAPSISSLTIGNCPRHPNGTNKGHHSPYQGKEKSQYVCEYCGTKDATISGLTIGFCPRHPNGTNKGHHLPLM